MTENKTIQFGERTSLALYNLLKNIGGFGWAVNIREGFHRDVWFIAGLT